MGVACRPACRAAGCRPGRASRRPAWRARPSSRPSRARAPSRRSGAPTVCTGFRAVSGSWKIMAISPPRTSRMRSSRRPSSSSPCQQDGPPVTSAGLGQQPRMLSAVTDLPEPDSPTIGEDLAGVDGRGRRRAPPARRRPRCGTSTCEVRRAVQHAVRRPSGVLHVERVAQAVADEQEAEHGEHDGQRRGRTAGAGRC